MIGPVSGLSISPSTPEVRPSRGARQGERAENAPESRPHGENGTEHAETEPQGADASRSANGDGLTPEERRLVEKLASTDRAVRSHEQAHMAVGGAYVTGGASYSYVTGPDGRRYAVGGEVSIDASPVANDPEATIRKARTLQAAANAPVDPSSQDRQVAAMAAQMEQAARQELIQLQRLQEAESQRARAEVYGQQSAPEPGSLISVLA